MSLLIDYAISGGLQFVALLIDDIYCRKAYKSDWTWFSWKNFVESVNAFNDNFNAACEALGHAWRDSRRD